MIPSLFLPQTPKRGTQSAHPHQGRQKETKNCTPRMSKRVKEEAPEELRAAKVGRPAEQGASSSRGSQNYSQESTTRLLEQCRYKGGCYDKSDVHRWSFYHENDTTDDLIRDHSDVPMIFRLTRTISLGLTEANRDTFSLRQIIQGTIQEAVLSSYLVDITWLFERESPNLKRVERVTILHGDDDLTKNQKHITSVFSNVRLHAPYLPVMYGTHHSKFAVLFYENGIRVSIFSANLLPQDWYNKTQSIWAQDFPKKKPDCRHQTDFETDLVAYFAALKIPDFDVRKINNYDFSDANITLVASTPGTHRTGKENWGHMKLRSVLSKIENNDEPNPEFSFQSSSLGSMEKKWLGEEIMESVNPIKKKQANPFTLSRAGKMCRWFIYPTVEQVRMSLEGYIAGSSIPVKLDIVKKLLQSFEPNDCLASWDGGVGLLGRSGGAVERERAMPHIKTIVCHKKHRIFWAYTGSHNLSKAAWGALQKDRSQLFIRSYELGVLVTPDKFKHGILKQTFSCTPENPLSTYIGGPRDGPEHRIILQDMHEDVSIACSSTESSRPVARIYLPIPYSLEPSVYVETDDPWAVDVIQSRPDVNGKRWPPE